MRSRKSTWASQRVIDTVGDLAKRDAAMVERGKMRTMLGSEMLRRYDLK
mgnify:CR=1 FL=1